MIASLLLPLILQSASPAADATREVPASAGPDSNPEWSCDDPQYQQEMNWCAGQDYAAADAQLNAQWKITSAQMKERDAAWQEYAMDGDDRPGWFASLLEAQRAWLTYRDAHCRLDGYSARAGSLEPLLLSTCKTALTRMRTQELLELANTPE